MTALRLRRITALGGNDYEAEFEDGSEAVERMRCVVFEHAGIPGMEVSPDLFMAGRVNNARAITAAVLALHRARSDA
jgi:hypothetical protein